MTLIVKSVEKSLGTVTGSLSITGAGFTPKAVRVTVTKRTETGDAQGRQTSIRSMGFASGAAGQRVVSSYSADNAASSSSTNEQQKNRNDSLILEINGSGVEQGKAEFTAFTADGCTINISNAFPTDLRAVFTFYGGTDITNVEVGTFIGPTAGGAQNQDVSLGFTPAIGSAIGFLLQSSNIDDNDNSVDSDIGFGAFVRPTEQGFLMSGANTANASVTQAISACNDAECMATPNTSISLLTRRLSFSQWLTNGMRFAWAEVSTEAIVYYYMVIKGGKWAIRPFTTLTSLADIVISGLGFPPVGGTVVSAMKGETASDAFANDAGWSLGEWSSSSARVALAQFAKDGITPSKVSDAIQHDEVYINLDENGSVVGLMDIKTVDADGATFTMDDADPSANFGWMIFAGEVTGGENPPGSLDFDIVVPVTVVAGHELILPVYSRGHTALDPSVIVTDNDVAGEVFVKIKESTDRQISLWRKKATTQTPVKTVHGDGGVNTIIATLTALGLTAPGNAVVDMSEIVDIGAGNSLPGFTPTFTDSAIILVLFSPTAQIITNIGLSIMGPMTKIVEKTTQTGLGASIAVAIIAQDGGPHPTGTFSWLAQNSGVRALRFAIKPVVGGAQSWTTTTLVDASGEQETVERPLLGTNDGVTYSIDSNLLQLGGHFVSGVIGDENNLVTLDRVRLVASATAISSVGVSYSFNGGLTWSPEILVPILPSSFGAFSGSGWGIETGQLFQIKLRLISGDANVHSVTISGQPRGPAN